MKKLLALSLYLLLAALPAIADVTNVPCGQLPALTGAITTSAGSCATGGVVPVANGGTGISTGTTRLVGPATNVNFGVAGDYAISTPLPSGFTQLCVLQIIISGANGNLTTSNFGVWTATGGTGANIIAAGTNPTVTTGAANTNNNLEQINAINLGTEAYTPVTGAIQFRVGTTVEIGRAHV